MDVVPLTQFPAGFRLDTLLQEDTALRYQVAAYYPRSAGNAAFNRQMDKLLKKQIAYCRPEQEKNRIEPSYLDFWIVRFEPAAKNIRCTFCRQTYYPGAAHYNLDTVRLTYTGN